MKIGIEFCITVMFKHCMHCNLPLCCCLTYLLGGKKIFLHHIDLESHQHGMKMARCIRFLPRNFYCAQLACEVLISVAPHATKLAVAQCTINLKKCSKTTNFCHIKKKPYPHTWLKRQFFPV